MLYKSLIEQRAAVMFPEYTGERVYMREFFKNDGLPSDLLRWQPTVDAMLDGVDSDGPIYIMIDQGIVRSGNTHRRPGMHIDGYWNPGATRYGSYRMISASGHRSDPPGHRSAPTPASSPNRHSPEPTRHSFLRAGHSALGGSWQNATFAAPEDIILASNIASSESYIGEYEAVIGDMGNCENVALDDLDRIGLAANFAYAGNVTCLHASLPVATDVARSLVRLNVPGWSHAHG